MRRLAILTTSVVIGLLSSVLLGSADTGRTVTIRGIEHFVPNTLVFADFRFSPGPLSVKSGEKVTWTNTTTDPHTVSIVNAADLPTNISQVFHCGAPGTVCAAVLACHFPNGFGPGGPNPPIVPQCGNAVNGQLSAVGDSTLVRAPGIPLPSTVTFNITAPAGSTLHYMCVIHPWMQGEIDVI
jgi:plastocyanin